MRKQITEITAEDYALFLKHKRLTSYMQPDIAEINYLVKTYINEHHANCSSCGSGGLRVAKDLAAIYLANGESQIIQILEAKAKLENKVVVDTTEETKKKNKKKKDDTTE